MDKKRKSAVPPAVNSQMYLVRLYLQAFLNFCYLRLLLKMTPMGIRHVSSDISNTAFLPFLSPFSLQNLS